MEKKISIYKNDLKFADNFDLEKSEFESELVEKIYNNYKSKPKIELRIADSQMEKYEYLDLSNLNLNDELLNKLLKMNKIASILKKIKFLDLSTNDLQTKPDLSKYKNILYLSISRNSIVGDFLDDNLIELTCDFNKITKIKSNSIVKLSANNNLLSYIDVPNIKVMNVNYNKLIEINEYKKLEYLECISNQIKLIKNLINLQEIYVGNNNIEYISNLPNLLILNCVNNPIKKIPYFNNINLILSTTPIISSKYKISNINKFNNDYIININKE
jgi:Leucine-rich repeat (LRR) protein